MRERGIQIEQVEWQGQVNLVECVGDGSDLINYEQNKYILIS